MAEEQLTLFVRQVAWLGAVPDKQKLSRLEAIQKGVPQVREKIDSDLPEDSVSEPIAPLEVNLPEIDPAFLHLKGLFFLSGQAIQTGQGLVPLSWSEIKAFLEVNELELTLWEKETLKKMSEAYCAEYATASDPKRPAPYAPYKELEEIDHIALALKMRESMNQFRKK